MKIQRIDKLLAGALLVAIFFGLTGCAALAPKVPMASLEEDTVMKNFPPPKEGMAGLYIYRENSLVGAAIVDNISLDGIVTGKVAINTFIHREITPGPHTLSIPTEFASYKINLEAENGKNYFVNYYVRMGVFRGNGALEMVEENMAKEAILKLNLAK
jgi:hypothetical protein